jgi:hypothetical protein
MCFSQPKPPEPLPPPAPPPEPLPPAEKAVTQRATQPKKQKRGTSQLTATRRPTLSMSGGNGGTGVQLSQ